MANIQQGAKYKLIDAGGTQYNCTVTAIDRNAPSVDFAVH
jgi:hypothetical protein